MLNSALFKQRRRRVHGVPGILLGIACLSALSAGQLVLAAALPDTAKPRSNPTDSQIKPSIPPNMRRFLAKPDAELPTKDVKDDTQIEVNVIQLDGVIDRPEHGILLSELGEFVEQLRQKALTQQLSKENSDKDSPLSREKRDKLLKKLKNTPNGKSTEEILQELEQTIQDIRRDAEPSNNLTLQQLQELAARVAQYYQERGFILVRAVIPPQTIQKGRVHIRILEGILGNVTVEKNQNYSREQMLQPFRGLVGQPVTKTAIEEAMLLLNDYPGLETFAIFRPGLHPGETDLLVSVLAEESSNTKLHLDNYGSEFTGEYRARLDMQWNNPSNAIDKLRASYSQTLDPSNGKYVSLYYERHAFGPKNILGFGGSSNDYSLGSFLEPFGMSGSSILIDTYWRRAFHRSRLFNSYGLLQLSRKSAKLNVTEGVSEDRADELTVFSIEGGFDWSSHSRRHMAHSKIKYSKGVDGLLGAMEGTRVRALTDTSRSGISDGSIIYAGGAFSKTNLDYDHWYSMTPKHMLHVSFRSQHSQDLLTSLEQMAIGGPNSVRAYSSAEFLRDTAISTSVEWLMRAPGFDQWKAFGNKKWGEVLQVSLFIDYAKGWLNNPLASDREVVSLSGVGAGFHFNYENISARFEFASPIGDEPPGNDRNPQYFFEMNFGF